MRRILCLCHDVTDADVRRAVRTGYDHPETVKRFTGALMGPCQGRTCAELVLDAIARETGLDRAGLRMPTSRPPAYAVPMGVLATGWLDGEDPAGAEGDAAGGADAADAAAGESNAAGADVDAAGDVRGGR